MSTNYYHRISAQAEPRHIGLSVSARRFLFQAVEAEGLTSFQAWKERLLVDDGEVLDEYDRPVAAPEFLRMVAEQQNAPHVSAWEQSTAGRANGDYRWVDAQGYSFDAREFS